MTDSTVETSGDPYPGKDLSTHEFVVSPEILGNYFEGLQLDPAAYATESPYGIPVVPSMVLTEVDAGFPGAFFSDDHGTLWIRQEWELHRPMMPDETYHASSQILDIYEHRDRTVVNQEVSLRTANDDLMAVGRHHQSFLLDKGTGQVKLRDPAAKGVRKMAVPDGEALEPVERVLTLEMCGVFFHGNANYHTDKEEARRLGFEDVVIGGRMTMSYIGDLMDRRFGKGWYEGGKLDIKFTNIVWPDERVVAKGVITDRVAEEHGVRANVAVWVEKPDGTVAIVGSASALE